MGYDDEWREHRRLFHQHFGAQAVANYEPQLRRAVGEALSCLLEDPENFMGHLRQYALDRQPFLRAADQIPIVMMKHGWFSHLICHIRHQGPSQERSLHRTRGTSADYFERMCQHRSLPG